VAAKIVRSLAVLALTVGVRGLALGADAKEVFEPLVFKTDDGRNLNYRLMKPKNYDSQKKYPLVLFFHGAGERGDDNVAQLVHGMNDFASDEIMAKYPAFVFAPQCPEEQKWADVDWTAKSNTLPEKPSPSLTRLSFRSSSLWMLFSPTMGALANSRRKFIWLACLRQASAWQALRHYSRTAGDTPATKVESLTHRNLLR
jgi:hypothetical protein